MRHCIIHQETLLPATVSSNNVAPCMGPYHIQIGPIRVSSSFCKGCNCSIVMWRRRRREAKDAPNEGLRIAVRGNEGSGSM